MARLIGGRYQLTSLVGRGPTGTVWQAVHTATEESVAVKLLDPEYADDPVTVQRFVRERHLLTAYLAPAFVRVREVIADPPELALVTELVPGINLAEQLARTGPLASATAAGTALAMAEALAEAHRLGVVHCELKPTNVLFPSGGPESGPPRITDARVARLARGYRAGGARFATPGYASPEVILGGPPVPATDVYGLGLVLYELLTAEQLCPTGLDAHLRARPMVPYGISDPLRELIEECVAADPAARPDATAVAGRLRRLLPSLATGEPGPGGTGGFRAAAGAAAAGPLAAAPRPGGPAGTGTPGGKGVAAFAGDPPRRRLRHRSGRHHRLAGRVGLFVAVGAVVATLTGLVLHSLPPALSASPPPDPAASPVAVRATPTTPQLTDAAKADTLAGATAFVRYWFDTLSYAVATGDTGPLRSASDPGCQTCSPLIEAVRDGWRDGGRLQGGGYTLRSVTPDGFFTLAHPSFGAVFDREPRASLDVNGRTQAVLPGTTFTTCRLLLQRAADGWLMLAAQADQPMA